MEKVCGLILQIAAVELVFFSPENRGIMTSLKIPVRWLHHHLPEESS